MKNRYENIVLEAEEGITFEVSKGTSGKLIIRALRATDAYSNLPTVSAGEYAEDLSVYTDKHGNKAVVPPGWTVSGIRSENTIWGKDVSLVIYRIPFERKVDWENPEECENLKKIFSQFVWVPVESLDSDGTLDDEHFFEKFGRRNYQDDEFSDEEFNEALKGELLEQFESVKKYGGYYISRYNISKSSEGKPQSVKGAMPWTNINFPDAKKTAATIEDNEVVKSHLTFGAENDSVQAWFINSKARTLAEIAEDSTNWGNYWNSENSPQRVVETGSCEEWCTNNIYDFAGNVDEWTQETNENLYYVIRGGDYNCGGDGCPAAYRFCNNPYSSYFSTGFRATLRIK